jgi:thiol-disulfide isomerase/thioredoxin
VIVRLIVALAVVAATVTLALVWRRREGRFSEGSGRFDRSDLGLARRDRPGAVLVEFFGEDCAPCVTVQHRIHKISNEVPDVRVVSIDAGARIDIADKHDVRRVPTLFVLDDDLRVRWRASGVPSEDAIRTALMGPDWAGRPRPGVAAREHISR